MMLTIIVSWMLLNVAIYLGYNWKWSRGLDLTMADDDIGECHDVCVYRLRNTIYSRESSREVLDSRTAVP